jgi:replication-associated recombination protein RarA
MKDRGMNTQLNDTAIDEIVASCNGDMRGALKALMLVNEQLEAELRQLHAVFAGGSGGERSAAALH